MKTTLATIMIALALCLTAGAQSPYIHETHNDKVNAAVLSVSNGRWSNSNDQLATIYIWCEKQEPVAGILGECFQIRAYDFSKMHGHSKVDLAKDDFIVTTWNDNTVVASDIQGKQTLVINFKQGTATYLIQVESEGKRTTETHVLIPDEPTK